MSNISLFSAVKFSNSNTWQEKCVALANSYFTYNLVIYKTRVFEASVKNDEPRSYNVHFVDNDASFIGTLLKIASLPLFIIPMGIIKYVGHSYYTFECKQEKDFTSKYGDKKQTFEELHKNFNTIGKDYRRLLDTQNYGSHVNINKVVTSFTETYLKSFIALCHDADSAGRNHELITSAKEQLCSSDSPLSFSQKDALREDYQKHMENYEIVKKKGDDFHNALICGNYHKAKRIYDETKGDALYMINHLGGINLTDEDFQKKLIEIVGESVFSLRLPRLQKTLFHILCDVPHSRVLNPYDLECFSSIASVVEMTQGRVLESKENQDCFESVFDSHLRMCRENKDEIKPDQSQSKDVKKILDLAIRNEKIPDEFISTIESRIKHHFGIVLLAPDREKTRLYLYSLIDGLIRPEDYRDSLQQPIHILEILKGLETKQVKAALLKIKDKQRLKNCVLSIYRDSGLSKKDFGRIINELDYSQWKDLFSEVYQLEVEGLSKSLIPTQRSNYDMDTIAVLLKKTNGAILKGTVDIYRVDPGNGFILPVKRLLIDYLCSEYLESPNQDIEPCLNAILDNVPRDMEFEILNKITGVIDGEIGEIAAFGRLFGGRAFFRKEEIQKYIRKARAFIEEDALKDFFRSCIKKYPNSNLRDVLAEIGYINFTTERQTPAKSAEDIFRELTGYQGEFSEDNKDAIKHAYKAASLKFHPDKQAGKSDEEKAKIKENFTALDTAKKVIYRKVGIPLPEDQSHQVS